MNQALQVASDFGLTHMAAAWRCVFARILLCRIAFVGVFDGHGGRECADWAAARLHANVVGGLAKALVRDSGCTGTPHACAGAHCYFRQDTTTHVTKGMRLPMWHSERLIGRAACG